MSTVIKRVCLGLCGVLLAGACAPLPDKVPAVLTQYLDALVARDFNTAYGLTDLALAAPNGAATALSAGSFAAYETAHTVTAYRVSEVTGDPANADQSRARVTVTIEGKDHTRYWAISGGRVVVPRQPVRLISHGAAIPSLTIDGVSVTLSPQYAPDAAPAGRGGTWTYPVLVISGPHSLDIGPGAITAAVSLKTRAMAVDPDQYTPEPDFLLDPSPTAAAASAADAALADWARHCGVHCDARNCLSADNPAPFSADARTPTITAHEVYGPGTALSTISHDTPVVRVVATVFRRATRESVDVGFLVGFVAAGPAVYAGCADITAA
ncbi:MAG: hypothetical protein ACYDAY_04850 [Candidatus Dormibacteria bacterium]